MPAIKFSHNWNNKLDNKVFTTIRKWTKEKGEYYQSLVNREFDVLLNGKPHSKAILKKVNIQYWCTVDEHLIMLDTGMMVDKAKELFKQFGISDESHVAIILLFEKEDEDK